MLNSIPATMVPASFEAISGGVTMKKTIAFVLMIVLLVSMLVMTGCAKQTTVEFTVEGINDASLVPFST